MFGFGRLGVGDERKEVGECIPPVRPWSTANMPDCLQRKSQQLLIGGFDCKFSLRNWQFCWWRHNSFQHLHVYDAIWLKVTIASLQVYQCVDRVEHLTRAFGSTMKCRRNCKMIVDCRLNYSQLPIREDVPQYKKCIIAYIYVSQCSTSTKIPSYVKSLPL